MKIELNREKKLILLKALNNGFVESEEIEPWFSVHNMTIEEIDNEIDRLEKSLFPGPCERRKKLGLCEFCKEQKKGG